MNALNPPDVARAVITGKITTLVNAGLMAGAEAKNLTALPRLHNA